MADVTITQTPSFPFRSGGGTVPRGSGYGKANPFFLRRFFRLTNTPPEGPGQPAPPSSSFNAAWTRNSNSILNGTANMRKNVASQNIGCQMVSATDGSAFTSAVTVYVTGDAGTQAIGSVGGGACTHEGNGYHTYAPAQAETNYDLIGFTFIGTGAVPATVQVETRMDANVTAALNTAVTLDTNNVLNVSSKYWAGTAITATSIPVATAAGAAGGLVIAGSNAATTFATLTSTGAFTTGGFSAGAVTATTITASGAVAFQSTFAVTTSSSFGAISGTTLTLSGAVAFQSTFAVTTSSSFGAISGTTLTLSGAVAFQSTFAVSSTATFNAFTVTNSFTVSGTTVHTGNVSMAAGLAITQSTANTAGVSITGNGSGAGLDLIGGNAVTTTPAGPGMKSTGGTASTGAGGVAGIGVSVIGGAGAASTNGAAIGAKFIGGGTNTVASSAHGFQVTGTSTGDGLAATSGAGTTGNGITATAASTNGSGMSHISTGTGSGILTDTLKASGAVTFGSTFTVTGAVAFSSTFAVTTSTSLAALSCTTLTASGAVAFQSTFIVTGAVTFSSTFATTGTTTFNAFTVTNNLLVSGTTTYTGVVTNSSGVVNTYPAGAYYPSNVVDSGTAQSATGTTLVLRAAAAFADSELVGATVVIRSATTGAGQRRLITANVGSTDTVTVDTWTTTPTGTIVYDILGTAPSSTSVPSAVNVTQWLGTAPLSLSSQQVQAVVPITQKVDVETIKTNPVVNAGTITFPTTATLASTTNITAGTITTATNVTTVNGLAANVITATSINADAITAAKVADGTIDAATFATGAINAAAIASDAITAAKIADGAIDTATFASGTTIPRCTLVDTVTTNTDMLTATAVWAAGTRLLTAGTNIVLAKGVGVTGFNDITAAAASTAVWSEPVPASFTSGQAGNVLGNIATGTPPTAAAIATAVWQDATAGDFTTANSIGKSLYNAFTANTSVFTVAALANAPTGGSAPTAAQIATAVWQDTTSGDFTVSSSIGKSLYTSGNAPGAASGLALVGSNVGTATSVSGSVGSVVGLTASNLDAAISSRMATYSQPTGFLAATFPATVASTTNITAASGVALTSAYDFAKGTVAVTESYAANGAAPSPVQALLAIHQYLQDFVISSTSYTVKKLDNSTTAFVVTLNDATTPTGAART